ERRQKRRRRPAFVACRMAGTALSSVILLVAGVVAMLVLHILIVVWALRRGAVLLGASGSSAAARDEERGAAAAAGLSAEELGELPCHERKAGDGVECAVCLDAFQAGDRCRVLPACAHGFHAQCVDSWLRKSRVCPICRAEVVVVVGRGKEAGQWPARSPPRRSLLNGRVVQIGSDPADQHDTWHHSKVRSKKAAPLPSSQVLSPRSVAPDTVRWSFAFCMARGAHSVVFLVTGLALVFVVHVVVVIWALRWALRTRPSRVGEQAEEAGGCGGGGAPGLSAEEVGELPCHPRAQGGSRRRRLRRVPGGVPRRRPVQGAARVRARLPRRVRRLVAAQEPPVSDLSCRGGGRAWQERRRGGGGRRLGDRYRKVGMAWSPWPMSPVVAFMLQNV
ncbi:hypothetical protein EJB05_19881, partial [Eragrostis curvula]